MPPIVPMVPTSLTLPPETVDLLRAAAKQILWESPEFLRLVKDLGATVAVETAADEP